MVSEFVPVDHPRFKKAQRAVFTKRVVADCMSHRCSLVAHGNRERLDACCQYGVDVDLGERDGILEHREQIAQILDSEVSAGPWFETSESKDPDFPSGAFVRTKTHDKGCVFLSHDGRGCAVHRAAVEGDWDFNGVKPHVCRLFPLSYESDAIVLSDDYADYSCAYDPDAPSVYQVARPTIEAVFGSDVVAALDRAEQTVLATRLPVAR